MAELTWDAVGSRRFETGLDRGVLYPPGAPGVPWNGLTDVSETVAGDPTPLYLDGIKFADRQVFSDYAAKLSAFTYPDELDRLVGVETYGQGLEVFGQPARRFGLSYRTKLGDDIHGVDGGYKIHLIYNAMATPSTRGSSTTDSNVAADKFDWSIDTLPVHFPGFRPTAHFVVNTRKVDADGIAALESVLYGTETLDPTMPTADELLALLRPGPAPSHVVTDGSWTMTGPDEFFEMSENDTAFKVRGVKTVYADENEYTMPTDDELEA